MEKERRLEELKAQLTELKKRDPSHCSEKTYVPHSMPPGLFQEIEDLEDEIRKLERAG